MLKVLYFLLFDAFFLFATIGLWDELRGFKFLLIAIVAFFTWQLFSAVRNWIGK